MNQETQKLLREYRIMLIVSNVIIVICVLFWAYLFFKFVPDTLYTISKQAFGDFLDERTEVIP